ncbi:MAG: hypothetical protein JWN30_2483 [Bacilli bacterium]|nr:hypothetical protein [Bacilli bacterium]
MRKSNSKILYAAAVIAVLLLAAFVARGASVTRTESETIPTSPAPPLASIAYVPLDDRPANTYFPEMVAKASSIHLNEPAVQSLGTFTTAGSGKAIGLWLTGQSGQVDGAVISIGMLAYGGLVASRTGDQSYQMALNNLQSIKQFKQSNPDKPVYAFDTIQRLATTATDPQTMQYADEIREWAILTDEVNNLGMQEKKARLIVLEQQIPTNVLQDYLLARARNHEINSLMIDWVKQGIIDYLVLSQDDAAQHGLHRLERDSLQAQVHQAGVDNQVTFFPGADEVGTILVARMLLDKLHIHPSVAVLYSGIPGSDWVPAFEDIPLEDSIKKHIQAAGGTVATRPEQADLLLMVTTPSAKLKDAGGEQAEMTDFVKRIKSFVDQGKLVAITDAATDTNANILLVSQLRSNVDLPQLASYTAWGTPSNNIGSALGHALARTAYLKLSGQIQQNQAVTAAEAQSSILLSSFVTDYSYRSTVKSSASAYVDQLHGNSMNLGQLYPKVNEFVQNQLGFTVNAWYIKEFVNHSVPVYEQNGKVYQGQITNLKDFSVSLPWPRLYEVKAETDLQVEMKPRT